MTLFLPELLAPAGNLEKLRTALMYGANAAYLGGQAFNLRAGCDGFTPEELTIGVQEANAIGARIYYCMNSLPQERHLSAIPADIETAFAAGVHAFIVADPGILRMVRKYAPKAEIHLSTQANTANSEAVAFWADQGVERVNLARELSHKDIYNLRKKNPKIELEVFVHGAMCLAISGQCLLSAWLNDRPANMGRCTQPCRFTYRTIDPTTIKNVRSKETLFEAQTENDYASPDSPCMVIDGPEERAVEECTRAGKPAWRVRTDEDYSSLWAPDDLCLLPYLPWFVKNKIHALKIEGRMRSAAYVAHAVDVYATALRYIAQQGTLTEQQIATLMHEIAHTAMRPMCSGFFMQKRRQYFSPQIDEADTKAQAFTQRPILARVVAAKDSSNGVWIIDVRANWPVDTAVELLLPGMRRPILPAQSYQFENNKGKSAEQVNCGTRATLYTNNTDIIPGIFIRGATKF